MVLASILSLPAGGKVQAFEWLVATGGFFMRGGLPPMRSEWWTLETVGDWGMLGRVRDLASMGLCSFLSSDLHRQHKWSITQIVTIPQPNPTSALTLTQAHTGRQIQLTVNEQRKHLCQSIAKLLPPQYNQPEGHLEH